MDILLLTAGVKASIRAAQAGIDLHAERAADKAVFLPDIELPPATIADEITHFLNANPEYKTQPPFASGWSMMPPMWLETDIQKEQDCIAKYLELKSATGLIDLPIEQRNLSVGGRMVEQWRASKQPPTVWSRMALTIVDIGIEFVAAYPTIMGESSKGEALVLAFANNLSELIPQDVTNMGNKSDFDSRLLGIFLRAGLTTLINDDKTIIEDGDVKVLVNGIVKPINDALPSTFEQQIRYHTVIEAIISDSAATAFSIIASNTTTYLGDKFSDERALGAVTQALLETTAKASAESDITAIISKSGVQALFKSVMGVAATKPALFVSDAAGGEHHQLLVKVFSETAAIIERESDNGLSRPMLIAIATLVIDTVGENANHLLKLDSSKPWESIAIELVEGISVNVSHALSTNQRLQLLSKQQQFEYLRIILQQTAQTPEMLGSRNQELNAIIAGISNIMAADEKLLISDEGWLQIVSTAAQIAGLNPQKLFGFDPSASLHSLAVSVIKPILDAATQSLASMPTSPLRGATLSAVIMMTLEGLAGNVVAVTSQPDLVRTYMEDLIAKIAQDPLQWGSESILDHIEATLQMVLATGTLPSMD